MKNFYHDVFVKTPQNFKTHTMNDSRQPEDINGMSQHSFSRNISKTFLIAITITLPSNFTAASLQLTT